MARNATQMEVRGSVRCFRELPNLEDGNVPEVAERYGSFYPLI